ncbi:hypothetical protein KKC65_03440 [Patescibacteria group bacterium]|nr:hypothetical protein [Patescibacteria group bacterium]
MFKFRSKRYKYDIEPQEVFLDELAKKKEEELGVSERKFEVPLSQKILKGLFFFILLLIFVLFAVTFNFQIIKGKRYRALSDDNKFITYSIKADRGVIYDIKGKQLVFNKPSFKLTVNESELPENEAERKKIFKEIEKITKGKYENIDHETLIILETRLNEFPGFYIEHTSTRYYEDSLNFSHVIGYNGKDGIEKTYDDILKKNSGEIKIERDVYGEILSKELISYPEPGKSLVLWLDSDLQKKVYQALYETLERTGSKKAVGIALNPKTGGVMALVSIPGYDNNLFNEGANQEELKKLLNDPQQPLFNRAIAGLYPTGSTIKPIIAAAALEEEIITYEKDIMCSGQIAIPHRYDPEITYYHKDWAIHGATDLRKALAESCNVYFYTIGGGYGKQEGLGPTRIKKYVELFGWGSETRIDLPGEASGFIPYPEWKEEAKEEPWFDGDTYNLSIGQGDISVTPLQVASAFSAIANGGTLYSPRIVKEIVDENRNVVQKIEPEIIRSNFINLDNLDIVRQGMRWAVTGENSPQASSISLNSLPIKVAAKTGTAQTANKDLYHNWVGVFAPYEDPEIVLVIMIENVKDLQAAALPTAKSILQYYFTK